MEAYIFHKRQQGWNVCGLFSHDSILAYTELVFKGSLSNLDFLRVILYNDGRTTGTMSKSVCLLNTASKCFSLLLSGTVKGVFRFYSHGIKEAYPYSPSVLRLEQFIYSLCTHEYAWISSCRGKMVNTFQKSHSHEARCVTFERQSVSQYSGLNFSLVTFLTVSLL